MSNKFVLISLLVTLSAILVAVNASAALSVSSWSVNINGITDVSENTTVAVFPGEIIPMRVVFVSNGEEDNVRLRAWMSGYRDEISVTTERFDTKPNKTYSRQFSLKMPADIDKYCDGNCDDDYTLYIRLETKTSKIEKEYRLEVQRESYELNILSVEVGSYNIKAGDTIPVSVVIKNVGSHNLDDVFVIAKIDSLGIERKAYLEDLIVPCVNNGCDNDDERCCDEDSAEAKLLLKIPENAEAGSYELQVTTYNDDVSVSERRNIEVVGGEEDSKVLTTTTSKTVAVGEEAVYEVLIINSGNKMQIYNIAANAPEGLSVSVDEPIVTVPADSSRTVKVSVVPQTEGKYNFMLTVSQDSQAVKQVSFGVNAEGKIATTPNPVVALTIVLAIIFVVLLIVLIVLLTRKPEKTEEFGESYY